MKSLMRSRGLLLMVFLCARTFAAPELDVRTDIEFAKIGDTSLKLDSYIPKGPGPYPAIVWVHGGGFVSGDKKQYPPFIMNPIYDAGFAMISVNYRLAPKDPFPAATDDVEAGVHYIKQHAKEFKVDPDRLFLMGESAGGLLVSLVGAAAKPQNRVAGVVSFYGEHDLITRVAENPCILDGRAEPKAPTGCLSPGIAAFLGIKEVNPETMKVVRAASAVTYVKRDMPPFLLIHGTHEFHVPFEQAMSMKLTMDKAGADCTLIPIIGGAHGSGGWEKLPQAKEYKEQMIAWLKKYAHLN
jgi:acetyl esterase